MSKQRFPKVLLADMLHCIDKLQQNTSGLSLEALLSDEWLQDAIYRNFEVIGEAANKLPEEIRAMAPDVPWREVIGMRNRLIHDYAGIDTTLVLETLLDDLPVLKAQLRALLDQIKT